VDRLDDEQVPVRASVVWTLGYVDTEASRDALRETADVDPDPDVRALAAELLSSETIG
jgi:HEAT repeat protein